MSDTRDSTEVDKALRDSNELLQILVDVTFSQHSVSEKRKSIRKVVEPLHYGYN